jgi:hypothetical protein
VRSRNVGGEGIGATGSCGAVGMPSGYTRPNLELDTVYGI